MDLLKSETWKQLVGDVIANAPYAIPLMLLAAWAAWFVRGTLASSKINGLEQQIAVREDRLKLAEEKVALQKEAREEADRRFAALKTEIEANAPKSQLSERITALEAALSELTARGKAVEGVLHATEAPDTASFR